MPALVERKGVTIRFLQHTARSYRGADIQALRPTVDIVVVSHPNRDGSTPEQFAGTRGTSPVKDREHSDPCQQTFAHMAIDLGGPILYAIGL